MTEFKEEQLVEQKNLRDQCVNRVEVLDKVKKLFLIPKFDVMTTKMIADYYEVGLEAIQSCYKDNKSEIDLDGVCIKPYKDFLSVLKGQVTIGNGKTTIDLSDTIKLVVPRRGVKVFPQRAILRVGMLLRDSTVAKEVRTQLLNTFEHSTYEQKTVEIDEELRLKTNLGIALASGDINEFAKATIEYNAYTNRYIKGLETTNALLSRKAVEWGYKPMLNALIRKYALVCFHTPYRYSEAWNALYRQVKYKCGWDILARKGKNKDKLIDRIKESEFPDIVSVAVGLCTANNIDVGKVINEINAENVKS